MCLSILLCAGACSSVEHKHTIRTADRMELEKTKAYDIKRKTRICLHIRKSLQMHKKIRANWMSIFHINILGTVFCAEKMLKTTRFMLENVIWLNILVLLHFMWIQVTWLWGFHLVVLTTIHATGGEPYWDKGAFFSKHSSKLMCLYLWSCNMQCFIFTIHTHSLVCKLICVPSTSLHFPPHFIRNYRML